MNRSLQFLTLLIVVFGTSSAIAQARNQLRYDWQPSQLTGTFQWTVDDYSLRVSASELKKTRLSGGGVEYAFRNFYPWEVVATAQYSQGEPLAQRLLTAQVGAGYCRGLRQWIPFGRLLVGAARTSSNQDMYLYKAAKTGLAFSTSAGVDYQIRPHLGVRLFQLQNQYLPFGSRGSVYWSFSSGITYRFHP